MDHLQRHVNTKIVATLGPASESPTMLAELAQAGADVFRLNFAHGTWEWHSAVVERIRAVSQQLRRPLAILQDLGGPKLRLGELPGGVVQCVRGDRFYFVTSPQGLPNELTCTHATLADELAVGDNVLIADGSVAMQVTGQRPGVAELVVTFGGEIRSRQGVAAPRTKLNIDPLTEKDLRDLDWTARHDIDFVGLSFVRRPGDITRLRHELERRGSQAQIVAKIEKAEALDCLDDIIRQTDVVMVARGDLGVEIDVARVPLVQKHIIERCCKLGVPVITATQMLESMRTSNQPTRAEATDVANAILDGTDAVMLSAETASGQYPRESVAMMARIAEATEAALPPNLPVLADPENESACKLTPVVQATVKSGSVLASHAKAKLVIVATNSGRAALALSKLRMRMPTVGVSGDGHSVRRMCLYWGVLPVDFDPPRSTSEYVARVDTWAKAQGLATVGDPIVIITGSSLGDNDYNMVLVHQVR